MLELILYCCLISLFITLFYYLYFFRKLVFYKNQESTFSKGVSVIICAKNEFDNLNNNLELFLQQDYPNFEVIVVNDQSTDNTRYYLDDLDKKYSHLTIVNIDDNVRHAVGKKFALTMGIKTAKHDYILLSDADCYPSSKNWISKMSQGFNDKEIILGYGSYEKSNGLLNKLIRFDTYLVAIQYFSYSLNSLTYMGVGRNLAYKKELFFKNKGFANHLHIASGDDDLFINEIANNNNVSINIEKDTHTISKPENSFKSWIGQKRRHLTTGGMYDFKVKFLLSLYPIATLVFWSSIIMLYYLEFTSSILMAILLIKLLNSYLSNYFLMKKLDVLDIFIFHPLIEIIHLFFQFIFQLLNINNKPKKWQS